MPQAGVGCSSRLTAWVQGWVLTCQQGLMLETMWGGPYGAGEKTASWVVSSSWQAVHWGGRNRVMMGLWLSGVAADW